KCRFDTGTASSANQPNASTATPAAATPATPISHFVFVVIPTPRPSPWQLATSLAPGLSPVGAPRNVRSEWPVRLSARPPRPAMLELRGSPSCSSEGPRRARAPGGMHNEEQRDFDHHVSALDHPLHVSPRGRHRPRL